MSEITDALRKLERMELGGLGAGLPSDASRNRDERSLNLIAARKVMARLDTFKGLHWSEDEIDPETGRRLAVSVSTNRSAEAVVPEGFEDVDAPERTFSLHEERTKLYRPYPFGLHSIVPFAKLHSVTLREIKPDINTDEFPDPAEPDPNEIVVTGSNKLGFYESDNPLEELVTFSQNLELIARAMGFHDELTIANEGLFLPENYASLRAH